VSWGRKTLLYTFIVLLSFVITLIATVPVGVAINGLQKFGNVRLPITVSETRGSIWDGSIQARLPTVGSTYISWDMEGLKLLTGQLAVSFFVENDYFEFTGEGGISLTLKGSFQLDGVVEGAIAPLVAADYRAVVPGRITVKDVAITASTSEVLSATGSIDWPGGVVSYQQFGRPSTLNVPAIIGRVAVAEDGGLAVPVTTAQGDEALMDLGLKPDGWAKAAVRQRLVNLGLRRPGKKDPDDIVVVVQPKLF